MRVIEFNRQSNIFIVEESLNPRQRHLLEKNWCTHAIFRYNCSMYVCSYWLQIINQWCFQAQLCVQCFQWIIWPNETCIILAKIWRTNYASWSRNAEEKKGRPRSTRIHIGMDQREREQLKRYSLCRTVGPSKNKCPNNRRNTSQSRQRTH